MKVLLLTASYMPVLGGLQTAVENVAQCLKKSGDDVLIVSNRYPRHLPQKEMLRGLEVRRMEFIRPYFKYLQTGRWDLFLASLIYAPMTCMRLFALVRKFNPDVVNVHFPLQQIPFLLPLCKKKRFKLVVSLHGDEVERFVDDQLFTARETANIGPEKKSALINIFRMADAVTACSEHLLNLAIGLEKSVQPKGFVTPNGIDHERFLNLNSYHHAKPYIFTFGRLVSQKGFDMLISAFKHIAEKFDAIDLILAGDGSHEKVLRDMVKELKLENRIKFYGRANQDELVLLLNGSEFVVIPSRRETFGIAALEAMGAGKSVLATEVGGMAELLRGKESLLVKPTEEALCEGLQLWLNKLPDIRNRGVKNRDYAANYSWAAATQKYAGVFNKVLNSNNGRASDK